MEDDNNVVFKLFFSVTLIFIPSIVVLTLYKLPSWIVSVAVIIAIRIAVGSDSINALVKQFEREEISNRKQLDELRKYKEEVEQLHLSKQQPEEPVLEKPDFSDDPDRIALVNDLEAIGVEIPDIATKSYRTILAELKPVDVHLLEEYRRFLQK